MSTMDLSSFSAKLVQIRRHLHAHPELSFKEKETSAYIQTRLKDLGVDYTTGWASYGIVVRIKAPIPTDHYIALRADMDALPIHEAGVKEYISKNPGVMHACGHDVHSTCLLGAIELIQANREKLTSDVVCIFQPGEELLPGGASLMMKEGALDVDKCKAIFALHVFPSLEVGKVGFRAGPYMASSDEIYIKIVGRGGHGAMPHQTADPIIASAHLITSLQTIVSRNCNPVTPCVLTIGKINSEGGATNVIPNIVSLEGTFRTMDETWREQTHELIRRQCRSIEEGFGVQIELNIIKGYPVLINDDAATQKVGSVAIDLLGEDNVEQLPIRMTSEDFAWYTQEIPGCFFRLGTGNKSNGITSGIHTSTFDVDEDCLVIGARLMAGICLQ